MKKFTMLFSLAALTVGGQVASAYPGQVVSFDGLFDTPQTIPVPSGGFVLTDIMVTDGAGQVVIIQLNEKLAETETSKLRVRTLADQVMSYHLNSGIPFADGTEISFLGSFNIPAHVTLSGYIPDPTLNGTVPAVGTWGLFIMGLLVISGATILIARCKPELA